MKNKAREVILGIILALPVVTLIILFAIKTKMPIREILFTFFATFIFSVIALVVIMLALMLFHVVAYYFLKLAFTFIRDYESMKYIPSVSVKNEDTSMFVSKPLSLFIADYYISCGMF